MVKDGEIVYPGTELIQSGELPPRKGMDFKFLLICSFFYFHCGDENGFQLPYCHKTLIYHHLSIQFADLNVLN